MIFFSLIEYGTEVLVKMAFSVYSHFHSSVLPEPHSETHQHLDTQGNITRSTNTKKIPISSQIVD